VGANSFGNWKHMEMIERYKSIHAKRNDGLKLKKKREEKMSWPLKFLKRPSIGSFTSPKAMHAILFLPSPNVAEDNLFPLFLGRPLKEQKRGAVPNYWQVYCLILL
jgi:hypothetical protein